jgi:hypothetical protein
MDAYHPRHVVVPINVARVAPVSLQHGKVKGSMGQLCVAERERHCVRSPLVLVPVYDPFDVSVGYREWIRVAVRWYPP